MTGTPIPDDLDAMHTSIAFTRAYIEQDVDGANAMLLSLSREQLPAFCCGFALWIESACEVANIEPGFFLAACAELIDSLEVDSE